MLSPEDDHPGRRARLPISKVAPFFFLQFSNIQETKFKENSLRGIALSVPADFISFSEEKKNF